MDRRSALKRTSLIMGTALTPGVVSAILSGCTPSKELGWTPTAFTDSQAEAVSVLVDRILPTTDTPGALDLGVDQFVDFMVLECYPANEIERMKKGIEELEKSDFTDLSEEKQIELLQEVESGNTDATYAFTTIKELTLLGYFTSEEGMKAHFNYVPIPGKYNPCEPLGEKMWVNMKV